MFISQEGKKMKMKEMVKGAIPLNYLEVTSTRGGGAYNIKRGGTATGEVQIPTSLSAPLWSEAAIRAQVPDI